MHVFEASYDYYMYWSTMLWNMMVCTVTLSVVGWHPYLSGRSIYSVAAPLTRISYRFQVQHSVLESLLSDPWPRPDLSSSDTEAMSTGLF